MANATPRSVLSVWQTLPAARWGTLALVLGVYAIASLEPFDWQIPRQVPTTPNEPGTAGASRLRAL